MPDLTLTPLPATVIFVAAVIAGYAFRRAWKEQPEGWQKRAWISGLIAGIGFLTLAFIPLKY
ncbi:MAG: hypothetical protein CR993_07095 [Rhodobacterales bacterium]|nr:MAG: hypothetical protein CR993_07095 [Rhodobacterales bacterium]